MIRNSALALPERVTRSPYALKSNALSLRLAASLRKMTRRTTRVAQHSLVERKHALPSLSLVLLINLLDYVLTTVKPMELPAAATTRSALTKKFPAFKLALLVVADLLLNNAWASLAAHS